MRAFFCPFPKCLKFLGQLLLKVCLLSKDKTHFQIKYRYSLIREKMLRIRKDTNTAYIYITFCSGLLDEQKLFFVRSDCCRVIFMSEDILTYNKVFILYTYDAYYVGSLEYSRIYVAKFYVWGWLRGSSRYFG